MTDDVEEFLNLLYIDDLLDTAVKRGESIKALRVGAYLQAAFIAAAGEYFANGRYRDVPVIFDANNPEEITYDTEQN